MVDSVIDTIQPELDYIEKERGKEIMGSLISPLAKQLLLDLFEKFLAFYNRTIQEIDSGSINEHPSSIYRSLRTVATDCSDCDVGYSLVRSSMKLRCVKNTCPTDASLPGVDQPYSATACQCENGVAEEICMNTSQKKCKSCNIGFHIGGMNGDRVCYHNRCTCENGVGHDFKSIYNGSEEKCEVHNNEKCASCNDGFELVASLCRQIWSPEVDQPPSATTCQCENGVAEEICMNTSQKKCKNCNIGFHMGGMNGDKVCYHNRCTCENGVGHDFKSIYNGSEEKCEVHNSEKCASCNEGFKLVASVCKKDWLIYY